MVEVPDLTNTSRAVSGFALSQLDGMAEPDPSQFFYVPFNLSHSVQVGETLAVEMVVFNYPGKEITAEVTLEPRMVPDLFSGCPIRMRSRTGLHPAWGCGGPRW